MYACFATVNHPMKCLNKPMKNSISTPSFSMELKNALDLVAIWVIMQMSTTFWDITLLSMEMHELIFAHKIICGNRNKLLFRNINEKTLLKTKSPLIILG